MRLILAAATAAFLLSAAPAAAQSVSIADPAVFRAKLQAMCEARGGRACFPRPALCTDNGAMIAFAGALRLQAGQHDDAVVHVTPRWDMAKLPAV